MLGLLGFGLQRFLTEGLTSALNEHIFPTLQSEYGLDLTIENAQVHLLKGRAEVAGLTLRNLEGYEKPMLLTAETLFLQIEWLSLLKRDLLVIKRAEAAGITLSVERNEQQKINIKELVEKLQSAKPLDEQVLKEMAEDLDPEERIPVAAAGAAAQLPVHIRRIAVKGTVLYTDAALERDYPLDLQLTGSDLFTVPAEDQPGTLLILRGSLHGKPTAFVTDLNAFLDPLTDPSKPSFNATGSMLNLNVKVLKELLRKNDMDCNSFSLKPSIICRKGVLDDSLVELILSDLTYRNTALGKTSLKLPLHGTIEKPELDLTGALQTLFTEQSAALLRILAKEELQKRNGDTNEPPRGSLSDLLIKELGKNVKEVDESKDLQDSLRKLGNSLLGE